MSQVIDINAGQLEGYLKQGNPLLMLIWIRSCDKCRRFKPIFNRLPDYYPDVKFLSMNMFGSLENLRLAETYEKENTPIIPAFCDGKHLGTFVGYFSMIDFREKLDEIFENNNCFA
jgi:thioredoxin-like negative regulator of GroEL